MADARKRPALREIVLRDPAARRWMIFSEPAEVLAAFEPGAVVPLLETAERRADEGFHVAGFLCYEAAPAFDAAYATRPPGPLPLAVFGVFDAPRTAGELPGDAAGVLPTVWRIDVGRERYRETVAEIRRQIALGNTYQVNYTVRQHAQGMADPWRLFRQVAEEAPYAAWVDLGDHAIVSASPELFFELSGDDLTCRPMKGTAARGLTTRSDDEARQWLVTSAKNRAENVMIADMVRNDLGRIAVPGSVRASSLCDVEKYPTVWQMTSTITARTSEPLTGIFRALFPSASITGAPKVSSMRLIARLEQEPRQIYTGSIGFIAPGRRARFSVAIRTALVDRREATAVYGVGGGVVWDSDADAEYEECRDKAGVLHAPASGGRFELLETLFWTRRDGCRLLDAHLERLADSARYFDFSFDRDAVQQALAAYTAALAAFAQRIRLRLRRDGALRIESQDAPPRDAATVVRMRLAREPIDLRNPFLYHKTTRREHYERALAAAGDCDDVLLWNERGEITESSIANVVARVGDRLVTPPVECGLLGGTLRRSLLEQGRLAERVIRIGELTTLDDLYLINSVRGWRRAVIDERSRAAG